MARNKGDLDVLISRNCSEYNQMLVKRGKILISPSFTLEEKEQGKKKWKELKNLKRGKKGKWSKEVNRRFNHWIYDYVLKRIKELCEPAGVKWHTVPANNTSKGNRNGEHFRCLQCGYENPADLVGAINVLPRFHREPIVPYPAKPLIIGMNIYG